MLMGLLTDVLWVGLGGWVGWLMLIALWNSGHLAENRVCVPIGLRQTMRTRAKHDPPDDCLVNL